MFYNYIFFRKLYSKHIIKLNNSANPDKTPKIKNLVIGSTLNAKGDILIGDIDITKVYLGSNIPYELPPYKQIQTPYLPKLINADRKPKRGFIIFDSKPNKYLIELIKENPKLLLLGDAGTGKSVELQNAFNQILEEGIWKPFFIDLKGYSDQDLLSLLPGIMTLPQEEVIIFIDGLDEKGKVSILINKIQFFIKNHRPKVRIVISCRANIYSSGLDEKFEKVYVQLLRNSQITQYCNEILQSPEKGQIFLNLAQEKEIGNLLTIPFYLTKIVEYYQKNGKLPEDKAILFELLIEESIKIKAPVTNKTLGAQRIKNKSIEFIEKLAFFMQCRHTSGVEQKEVINFLGDENASLIHESSSLININNNTWSFSHLNFQEYLAAKSLAKKTFPKIKKIIGIKPLKYKRIYPAWYNTLSFLIPLLNPVKKIALVNWIQKIEPHLLLNLEMNRLEGRLKEQILKGICEQHKEDNDEFDYSFKVQKLIHCAETESSQQYLLKELNGTSDVGKSNVIEILGHINLEFFPNNFTKRVKEDLWRRVLGKNEKEDIIRGAIIVSDKLFGLDVGQLKWIADNLIGEDTSPVMRHIFLIMLEEKKLGESFLNELISILQIGIIKRGPIPDLTLIEKIVQSFKNSNSILIFLNFLVDKSMERRDNELLKISNSLLENASQIAPHGKDLFLSIKKMVWAYHPGTYQDRFNGILKYLNETNSIFDMFQILYDESENKDWDFWESIGLWIDDKGIDFLINEIRNGNLKKNDLIEFQKKLQIVNPNYLHSYNSKISSYFDEIVDIPYIRNEEVIKKEREEELTKARTIFFNKEAYTQALLSLFDEKEIIKYEDLEKVIRENWSHKKHSEIFLRSLFGLTTKNGLSKKYLLKDIEENWETTFAIEKIKDFIHWNGDFKISLEELEFIKNWCDSTINKANFHNGLNILINDDFPSFPESYLVYFIKKYTFKHYSKEVYLELIAINLFIGEGKYSTIEFIEKSIGVPTDAIRKKVLLNIQEGIKIDEVLEGHLDFCKRENFQEVRPYLLPYLSDKYLSCRTKIAEIYFFLGGEIKELESHLKNAEGNFRDSLIDLLVYEKSPNIHKFLLDNFANSANNDKIKYAISLVKLQDEKALAWLLNQMRKTRRIYFRAHDFNNWENQKSFTQLLEMYILGLGNSAYPILNSIASAAIYNLFALKNINFSALERQYWLFKYKNKLIKLIPKKIAMKFNFFPLPDDWEKKLTFLWEQLRFKYYSENHLPSCK